MSRSFDKQRKGNIIKNKAGYFGDSGEHKVRVNLELFT